MADATTHATDPTPPQPGDKLSGKAKECFDLLAAAFDETGMNPNAIKAAKEAAELALIQAPNSSLYNLFHDNSALLSIDEATANRIAADWAKEFTMIPHPLSIETEDSLLCGPVNQFVIKKLIVEELLNRESKFPPIKGEEKSKADARAVLKEELKEYCQDHPVLNAKLFPRKQFNSRMLDELYDAIGKGDAALYDRALTQEYFVGIREIAEGLKSKVGIASANERVTQVLEGMKNQIGKAKLTLTMRDLTEVSDQVRERGGFAEGLLGGHAADYTLSKMLIDRIVIEPEKQAGKLRGQMHQAVFIKLESELTSLYNKNFRDADSLFTDAKLDNAKFQNFYAALGSESQEVFDNRLAGKTADGKDQPKTPVKSGAKVSAGVLGAVAAGGLVLGYLGEQQEKDKKHEAEMRGEPPKQGTNWVKWGGILLTLGAIGYGVYQYMNGKSQTTPQLVK